MNRATEKINIFTSNVMISKARNYLKKRGLLSVINKINMYIYEVFASFRFCASDLYSKEELLNQKNTVFSKKIKFSIIVPLYNTPEVYLREMIESVQSQTYSNWELCLADGSDEKHLYIGNLCREFSVTDKRIKYKKLEKNLGISGNTNEAIQMSSGEYIALFDHDDILHPSALHEVMKAICDGNADYIYTDEASFKNNIRNTYTIHFKPDYSPDTLLGNNYICHFSVVSRKLINQVGSFRSTYDGSQDHDFILRATDAANCIAHIPEVLYYWRSHSSSVAQSIESKPYAVNAGIRAVEDFVNTKGRTAAVTSTEVSPTYYRLAYAINGAPKVSIIIENRYSKALKECVESIITKTAYKNYEIVIICGRDSSFETSSNDNKSLEIADIKTVLFLENDNHSAAINYGVKNSSGDIIIILDNRCFIKSSNWIEEMLMYAQRNDVGAVGAKIYYKNGKIRHAGIMAGNGVVAGYYNKISGKHEGYYRRLSYAQNVSAVSSDCLMTSRLVWNQLDGLDENLKENYAVDYCLRANAEKGYLTVWTPFAELVYNRSSYSSKQNDNHKDIFLNNQEYRDPYYNENLKIKSGDIRFLYNKKPKHTEPRYTCKLSNG